MRISRKRFHDFEKRIANLEKAVQSQLKENVSYHWKGNLVSPETILRQIVRSEAEMHRSSLKGMSTEEFSQKITDIKKKKKASKMARTSRKPTSVICLVNKQPICQMDIFR